jgi:antitoxin component of MazEF toxin-antitoxin module
MAQYKIERKLQEQGGSLLVSLPRIWCNAHGLEDASVVEVTIEDDVRIRPVKKDARRG